MPLSPPMVGRLFVPAKCRNINPTVKRSTWFEKIHYASYRTSFEDSDSGARAVRHTGQYSTVPDSTAWCRPDPDSTFRAGGAPGMVFRAAFWAAGGSEEPAYVPPNVVRMSFRA